MVATVLLEWCREWIAEKHSARAKRAGGGPGCGAIDRNCQFLYRNWQGVDSQYLPWLFFVVNLKQFIQRDAFLASNAACLTRAQHLEVLWTFSPGAAVTPLPKFIKFDSFLALSVSHWSRERRLEELWAFLRWPPCSAAPNRPPDRRVPGVHPGRFQFRLVGGWEN